MAYIGPFPIVLPSGMTSATGDIAVTSGSFKLPNTTTSLVEGVGQSYAGGVVDFAGVAWIKNNPAGSNNIWIGPGSGNPSIVSDCIENTSVGANSLLNATGANYNCAFGYGTLTGGDGNYNVAVGYNAGSNYDTTESSNVLLNSPGTASESNVLRIGSGTGTGNQQLQSAFISGIAGVTVSSSAAVLINTTTGQLGTVSSSLQFKENIKDMADKSSAALRLRPVNFTFKEDPLHHEQWGLIAEEVHEVLPSLVTYDVRGNPSSVRYHDLPVILLNEIKKLNKRIEILESK
jgi:hypothetical protein